MRADELYGPQPEEETEDSHWNPSEPDYDELAKDDNRGL